MCANYSYEKVCELFDKYGYSSTCEFVRISDTKRGKIQVRCKSCGYEFARDTNILRNPQKKLRCPKCYEKLQADVLEYYKAGHSSNECAERFGITKAMVQNFAKKHRVSGGMSHQERGEYVKAVQKKACAASAKAAHKRALIRDNEKRIAKGWRDINADVDQWKKRIEFFAGCKADIERNSNKFELNLKHIEGYEPQIVTCKHCGKRWIFWPNHRKKWARVKNAPVFCSKKCNYKHYKTGTISDRLRRYGRANEYRECITLDEVIEKDNGICYLCGCKTSKADSWLDANGHFVCGDTYPTRDHVIPISKGGTHTRDNVRLACRKCNSRKSNTYIEEYAVDLG